MILATYKPHTLSLCEANGDRLVNGNTFDRYLDYSIEHTIIFNTTNRTRNFLLIKDYIIYNRRQDLENDIMSTIHLEFKLPKSKPILVASIY